MTRRLASVFTAGLMLLGVAQTAEVPRHSPEYAINLAPGKQILLSQYRGKVVALAFILTHCPHCQKTVGILSKMQNEYGARGLQVLACAMEDMAAMNVPDFIRDFHPTFPVGYGDRNSVMEYLQHSPMFQLYMPQLVFVDRQGTIRAQYAGEDKFFAGDQEKSIRDQIEGMLKAAPATKGTTTTGAKTGTKKTT